MPIIKIELADLPTAGSVEAERRSLYLFTENGLPIGQAYAAPDRDGRVDLGDLAGRCVLLGSLWGARKPPAAPDGLSVAVVICTRDRPADLAKCLASFAAQTRRPDEIIVVDNASVTDETRRAAEAAGVTYVREDRPGLDIARNTGATRATADIVAYTDDDVILHPRWLERLVAAFDGPQITAVTGLVLPGELETEAQYAFETQWGFGRGYQRIDFGPSFYAATRKYGCPAWQVGAGASMAFRREVFARIGLFDERLDVGASGCSGDSEFWNRVLHHGGTCRYEPWAVAYHFHRRAGDALTRQIRAYMSGHTSALLVQYERTGERGNLFRLFWSLPVYFAKRVVKRLLRGRSQNNRFLKQEILGAIAGVRYYWKASRIK